MQVRVPMPSVVVLAGPPGSGKSTWAKRWFPDGVLSSDVFRAIVGESDKDQRASSKAFELLGLAIDARLDRGLSVVIDTMGFNRDDRRAWVDAAHAAGMEAVAVAFDVEPRLAKKRNSARARKVPSAAMTKLLAEWPEHRDQLARDGFDAVFVTDGSDPVARVPRSLLAADASAERQRSDPLPIRFGLHVSSFEWDGGSEAIGPAMRSVAQTAEQLGFSSLRLLDHPMQIPQVGRAWDAIVDPFTTLAHVAAVTERIRLGPLVASVTFRNIAMLGKTMATLDVLSGGRSELGLGMGWYEREHRAYGIDLPSISQRAAMLEDALQFLPMQWGPGAPAFEGRTFSTPEAIGYPRPIQDPIPILVGGQGEKTTLRLVAQYAQACNLFGDVETVTHKRAVLAEHCAAFGRDPADIAVTHLSTTLVGRDTAEVERLVEVHAPPGGVAQWRAGVHAGTVDDQVGRFRALAEAGVEEAIVALTGDVAEGLERFAPVVEAFAR